MSATWLLMDTAAGNEEGNSPFVGTSFPGCLIDAQANMSGANMVLNGANAITVGDSGLTQITQPLDAKRYVLVADDGDGLPALTSTGIDEFFESASAIALTSWTIYTIWLVSSTSGVRGFYSHFPSGDEIRGIVNAGRHDIFAQKSGTLSRKAEAIPGTVPLDTYFLTSHTYGGTHATHEIYRDSVLLVQEDVTVNDPGTASGSAIMTVGAVIPTAGFLFGKLRAHLVYTPAHSAANRDGVTAGMNAFWKVF